MTIYYFPDLSAQYVKYLHISQKAWVGQYNTNHILAYLNGQSGGHIYNINHVLSYLDSQKMQHIISDL